MPSHNLDCVRLMYVVLGVFTCYIKLERSCFCVQKNTLLSKNHDFCFALR